MLKLWPHLLAGQGGEAVQCEDEQLCLGSALGQGLLVALLQLQSRLPGSELNLTDCTRFAGTSCVIKSALLKSCTIFNLVVQYFFFPVDLPNPKILRYRSQYGS